MSAAEKCAAIMEEPVDVMEKEIPREDGDEVEGGIGTTGSHQQGAEFTDPAILAMSGHNTASVVAPVPAAPTAPQSPEFRYSREELINLRNVPMSQKKPEYLDAAYESKTGVWDPESWNYAVKAQEGPGGMENGTGGPGDRRANEPENHRQRRPGDPRERIRKEQDGIVLSPQRRSFNSGCFVPVTRPNRPHSPLGAGGAGSGVGVVGVKGDGGPMGRDMNAGVPGGRRIGSGRILPWDNFQEKSEPDNEQTFGGYPGPRERRETNRDERFERRSFGRDFDMKNDRDMKDGRGGGHLGRNSNNNNRYNNRRISNDRREEEEPEWFSGGPISQNDTIELRGFDDNERVGGPNKRGSKAQTQKKTGGAKTSAKEQQMQQQKGANKENVEKIDEEAVPVGRTSPAPLDGGAQLLAPPGGPPKPVQDKDAAGDGPHIGGESAYLEFLTRDSIPLLLSNGVESGDAAGSRFSRWFKREQSPPTTNKLTVGDHEDMHHRSLIKNLLGDVTGDEKAPSVAIPQPGDSESYFAPISPQATSVLQQQAAAAAGNKTMNLMEMLQRGNKQHPAQLEAKKGGGGKILSLEELESRMMHNDTHGGKLPQKPEEDINAFKRLFSGVSHGSGVASGAASSGGAVGPGAIGSQQKPMSIMEMLTHSQQQDEAARLANQRMNSTNLPPHLVTNDLTYKLQQAQNQVQQQQKIELFSKLMSANQAMQQQQPLQQRTSPLQEMGVAQSRELLNRPEAQAILHGLKRGDITPAHLFQQLANPAMQPRHRDLLQTIIKMQQQAASAAPGGSPVAPPPQQQSPYQQQNSLRISPLPSSNAFCVSPILATSPNTLSVPAMHQRIPSPRELQVHTQNIMQRALIKKKLEEQQENYRKKQEAQHRGTSPGGVKTASPTPLAFTPTAVLRKMTADKDDGSKDGSKIDKGLQQQAGRALTGMRATQQQQQAPPTQLPPASQIWNNQFQQQVKQPGRPIVKANNNYQLQASLTAQQEKIDQFLQQQQRLHQQQHQQRKNQQTFGIAATTAYQQQQTQAQQQQQYPQLSQQQLRAQHQNVRAQHQQQSPAAQQQQQQQPSYHQHNANQWAQQVLQNQSYDGRQQVGRGGMDGDLSPTSNQLARWFSPELLERARKGKLAGNAMPQHALSLEDIERQTAPVGHN